MAKVGAQRAAELTGKSKSTIQRAMKNGKLSFEIDTNDRRVIDVSELERVFGLEKPQQSAAEQEMEKVNTLLENERLKMRVTMLEKQLESAEAQIEDLKGQRDQWQKQASQVMLTSQYSQKQAEDLKQQLEERDRRVQEARLRRQQKLEERMQSLADQNANANAGGAGDSNAQADSTFKGLWKKVRRA